ncbi:hypothetical protein AB3N59_09685 [Leptospira sp. WS92.C1]
MSRVPVQEWLVSIYFGSIKRSFLKPTPPGYGTIFKIYDKNLIKKDEIHSSYLYIDRDFGIVIAQPVYATEDNIFRIHKLDSSKI